jgi:hypothetical protein
VSLDLYAAPFTRDGQLGIIHEAANASLTLSVKEFETVCVHAGRNHGPALLYDAQVLGVISNVTLARVIGGIWSGAEFPERSLTRRDWVALFRAAGFTIDGHPGEQPSEAVRLWRGAPHGRHRGMSWTNDRAVAEKFAAGRADGGYLGRTPGKVWETLAPGAVVLCIDNHSRQEAEYVLDTRGLKIKEAEAPGTVIRQA